ncbi:hypothetical protein [Actinomadura atramentaria]|uniref:hypothetical protein n=1 Tax=Actinomadura atramentaria TaxID=1990 RepID=UPI0003A50BDA|nr:hypothetical protein [Actinomadura atramentaria]
MDGPWVGDVRVEAEGSQSVVGNFIDSTVVQNLKQYVLRKPSMVLSNEAIEDGLASYVPTANHDVIVAALADRRAVALAGPDGSGRTLAGIAAMRQLVPGLRVRRFETEGEDVETIPDEPWGYLLRAADEDPGRVGRFLEVIEERKGYLVLVGGEDEQRPFADVLPPLAVEPPPALEVYRRRLLRHALGGTGWPEWPAAARLLATAPPAEGRRLADVVEAVHRSGGDAGEVEQAYSSWTDRLDMWFRENPDPQDRALLIVAAALAPADETSVYTAARSLARHLDVRPPGGGLAWRPAKGLAALLDMEKRDGELEFTRYGFAESVIPHVLDEYPLTHSDLFSWLAELPTIDVTLPKRLRQRLAGVFADLAADHGHVEAVLDAMPRWVGAGGSDLAFVALSRICVHPRAGGRVRGRMYDWSRDEQASDQFRAVLAETCGVLGEALPTVALTRLKHLAAFGGAEVRRIVAGVALGIAEKEPETVLNAALDWCGSGWSAAPQAARRRAVGARLFLELAGRADERGVPVPLSRRHAPPRRLARGWRAALTEWEANRDPLFFDVVNAWLDAAVLVPALAEDVVAPMLAVEGGDPRHARAETALFLTVARRMDARGAPVALLGGTADRARLAARWRAAADAMDDDVPVLPVADSWTAAAAAVPDSGALIVDVLLTAAESAGTAAGVRLFLAVAGRADARGVPVVLFGGAADRSRLIARWTAALDAWPRDAPVLSALDVWAAGTASPEAGPVVVDVLLTAAASASKVAGARFFLALARRTDANGVPTVLADPSAATQAGRARLVTAWRLAQRNSGGEFFDTVRDWLDAAVRVRALHRVVVNILLTAASGGPAASPGGAALFLAVAERVDPQGAPLALVHDADALTDAWRAVLADDAGSAAASRVLTTWFGAGAAVPAVLETVTDVLVGAVAGDVARELALVSAVSAWAGRRRDRRAAKEAVLVRLLQPRWKRYALIAWITVRDAAGG